MKQAWKQLDLGGEGLQTLNARYTRQMRRRPLAYSAMLLFPSAPIAGICTNPSAPWPISR